MITNQESKTINSLRFICIVFLVLLHTQVSHLTPSSNKLIVYIQNFSHIPFLQILFFISGFLFFYNKTDNVTNFKDWLLNIYISKLRKRVKTLLIPYFIWCVIAILYNTLVKKEPFPHSLENLVEQFWDTGDGQPIGKAMWYIKSLIVFSLLSPFYLITIRKMGHLVPIIFLIIHYYNIPITYPFFNSYIFLGGYIAIFIGSLNKVFRNFDWRLCLMTAIIIKIFEIFYDIPLPFNTIAFFIWIAALWGILYKYPVPALVASSSSFIYFVHPYFTGIRNIYIKLADVNSGISCTIVWISTALTVLLICFGLFILSKKICPKIAGVFVGDRL